MFNHSCIKCHVQYNSDEEEPYYCETCLVEKKAIAKSIDEKMQGRPKKEPVSALDAYDASPKFKGFMIVKL